MSCNFDQGLLKQASSSLIKAPTILPLDTISVASSSIALTDKNGVSAKQYQLFIKKIVTAINDKNAVIFNKHFDLSGIVAAVTQSVTAPKGKVHAFKNGIASSINAGKQVSNALGNNGRCKLIAFRGFPESPTAILRFLDDDNLNYYELYLGSKSKKQLYITDFYIYRGGLTFSNTLKKLYLSTLVDVQTELVFPNNTSKDKTFVASLPTIDAINGLIADHEYEEALKTLNILPKSLENDKMLLMMRLDIAFNISNKSYKRALKTFKKHYPKDPVVEFIQVNFALLNKDYQGLLQIIDDLDHKIGGDPYLKVLKGNVHQSLKRPRYAEDLIEAALKEEPDNEQSYWHLLRFYLDEKQYEKATSVLTTMNDKFDIDAVADLIGQGYQHFFDSNAYQTWMQVDKTLTVSPPEDLTASPAP